MSFALNGDLKTFTGNHECSCHVLVIYFIQGSLVVRAVTPLAVDIAECLRSRVACSYAVWGWGFKAGASVQEQPESPPSHS